VVIIAIAVEIFICVLPQPSALHEIKAPQFGRDIYRRLTRPPSEFAGLPVALSIEQTRRPHTGNSAWFKYLPVAAEPVDDLLAKDDARLRTSGRARRSYL
jgi:hypothetical protein